MGAKKDGKRAALSAPTNPAKRVAQSPAALQVPVMQRTLRVRLGRLDLEGPWCLTKITTADHMQLLVFIKKLETMRVSEVFNGTLGKDEDVAEASPNSEARKRAREVYPDDTAAIARVNLGNLKRLWGLRYEEEFYLTWWDPKHEIWPANR